MIRPTLIALSAKDNYQCIIIFLQPATNARQIMINSKGMIQSSNNDRTK